MPDHATGGGLLKAIEQIGLRDNEHPVIRCQGDALRLWNLVLQAVQAGPQGQQAHGITLRGVLHHHRGLFTQQQQIACRLMGGDGSQVIDKQRPQPAGAPLLHRQFGGAGDSARSGYLGTAFHTQQAQRPFFLPHQQTLVACVPGHSFHSKVVVQRRQRHGQRLARLHCLRIGADVHRVQGVVALVRKQEAFTGNVGDAFGISCTVDRDGAQHLPFRTQLRDLCRTVGGGKQGAGVGAEGQSRQIVLQSDDRPRLHHRLVLRQPQRLRMRGICAPGTLRPVVRNGRHLEIGPHDQPHRQHRQCQTA